MSLGGAATKSHVISLGAGWVVMPIGPLFGGNKRRSDIRALSRYLLAHNGLRVSIVADTALCAYARAYNYTAGSQYGVGDHRRRKVKEPSTCAVLKR
jgi:hypothetical protein